MNFRKLSEEEVSSFLNMYNQVPGIDIYEQAARLFDQLGSQGLYPESIIDLYIASKLEQQGIKVPVNYDINQLTPEQLREITNLFGLSSPDPKRIQRILKILPQQLQIIRSQYVGPGQAGDFSWMMMQPQYNDVLFLFNDNQEQFLAFLNGLPFGCTVGSGNAVIRPYQCVNPPRAAGIPTGKGGKGYQNLNEAKPYIDAAFQRIKQLINTGRYKSIAYSAASDGRTLGAQIFSPSPEIKEYIVQRIEELAK